VRVGQLYGAPCLDVAEMVTFLPSPLVRVHQVHHTFLSSTYTAPGLAFEVDGSVFVTFKQAANS
jgi:hypothetical protein